MKASDAVKKASELNRQINLLIRPINERLSSILDDDEAHLVLQPGDGWCICYNNGDNAALLLLDIDELLNMSKEDCLAQLQQAGI